MNKDSISSGLRLLQLYAYRRLNKFHCYGEDAALTLDALKKKKDEDGPLRTFAVTKGARCE